MLLEFVYTLCFCPEIAFRLISRDVLVIHFLLLCFDIRALGLFYFGALLDCCLRVVAESEGCRVIFFLSYLI